MEETFKTDIIDGKVINWDKLSDKELDEIKEETERKEQEIIQKLLTVFTKFVEE